ncbi:MAG: type II secretion system F family protein [Acidimicrobiia bacterium]
MTYLGALAVGLLVHQAARDRLPGRRASGAAFSAALIAAVPASFSIVASGWTWVLLRARRNHGSRSEGLRIDHVGQVLFIALSAGLSVAAALEFAANEVGPAAAGEIRSVLRNARHRGLAVALSEADGATGRLFAVLARSQLTGASAVKAVAAFVDEERRDRRARAAEAAQRLPVKLTVPLALLILPGFVLLTFGPTVIATVQRLLGPLLS